MSTAIFNDPMWGPLSLGDDPNLREVIANQKKQIAEQKTLLTLRDGQIKRLKAKEASNGVQILDYLQALEKKFDHAYETRKIRPASEQFDGFTETVQRRIMTLEKRLQLRDDAMQLINAMLVDTITSKDAEIEALSVEVEAVKSTLHKHLEALRSPDLENLHIVQTRVSHGSDSSLSMNQF